MGIEIYGIVALLEGEQYNQVKKFWNYFEERFNSRAVQEFAHPHLTFQAGRTHAITEFKKDFAKFAARLKPISLEVDGFGHFDKRVIFLKVKLSKRLYELNSAINKRLANYFDEVFDLYKPEIWVPHITLAMDDLTEENFDKAWKDLKGGEFKFRQTLHNLALVKLHSNGKIRLVKRFELS